MKDFKCKVCKKKTKAKDAEIKNGCPNCKNTEGVEWVKDPDKSIGVIVNGNLECLECGCEIEFVKCPCGVSMNTASYRPGIFESM